MNRSSKRSKRRKLSSSSSDEDTHVFRKKQDPHSSKSSKSSRSSRSHESHGKEHKKPRTDDVPTIHKVKKTIGKTSKRKAKKEETTRKEKHHTTTKKSQVSLPTESFSSVKKIHSSREDKKSTGKTAERARSSKPLDIKLEAGSETSKFLSSKDLGKGETKSLRIEKKCSSKRSSKEKQQKSPTASEQGDQRQIVNKDKSVKGNPQRSADDPSNSKTQDSSSTYFTDFTVSEVKLTDNSGEAHHSKEPQCKNSSVSLEKPSSFSRKSFSSVNPPASESSSKVLGDVKSSGSGKSVSATEQSSVIQKLTLSQKFVPFKFKIPKKVHPHLPKSKVESNAISANQTKNKPSDCEIVITKTDQNVTQAVQNSVEEAAEPHLKDQEKRLSISEALIPASDTNAEHQYDQANVVEELHLARSEKKLEVNVMESYGELTCMEIDLPEEGPSNFLCHPDQALILVLDTNVLLSHLDYIKKISSLGLGGLGFPVVLIPWVVLQELDSLKKGRGLSGSVAHLAIPAISYIYNSLKKRDPRLWGQSMQQASESSNGLNAVNNDDRVLQCCLQYQNIYPECALILCTNDKNLCSKALLSGVKALSKSDLEAEVEMSGHGHDIPQRLQVPVMPHNNPQMTPPVLSISSTTIPTHNQQKINQSQSPEKDDLQKDVEGNENEEAKQNLITCLFDLEKCLLDVLSNVLEMEMRAAYEELWQEIVYKPPPWTLRDVLQCFKKHWFAVFGQIVPRDLMETVTNLINFFCEGQKLDEGKTSVILLQAKELVKAFAKSSNHVPQALSELERIFNKLQPQTLQKNVSVARHDSDGDVVMNEDDEGKQAASAQVSHQDVWALFENIWSHVYQMSLEVFKALSFDPRTMQFVSPVDVLTFPQDALACLHKLSSVVAQLLQGFSSILSSTPTFDELQTLIGIMFSTKIVEEHFILTAKDLLDCFAQPEYREKLRVGGSKLVELKQALDCCVHASNQRMAFNTQL